MSDAMHNPSYTYRYVRYRLYENTADDGLTIGFFDANDNAMVRKYKDQIASSFDIGNLDYRTVIDEILDGAK